VPRKLRKHRSLYMRVIDGPRSPVHVPKNAYNGFETIGRDRRGRVVLPFVRQTLTPTHYLVNPHWWLYDVAGDTIRPLRSLPDGKCSPVNVSIWRKRIAYHSHCDKRPGRAPAAPTSCCGGWAPVATPARRGSGPRRIHPTTRSHSAASG
jgi:hypothetical protein